MTPVAELDPFVATPVASSVAVTSTPATAAPLGSPILPVMRPVWLCANTAAVTDKITATLATHPLDFMANPSEFAESDCL